MSAIRHCILCCLVAFVPGALAARVEIALRVPLETVRQALAARLGEVYRQGPCRHLNVGTPALAASAGRLRLAGPGTAAFGVEMLGKCQAAAWQGTMEFTLAPQIDALGRLRMRILDSRLGDAGAPAAAFAWDLSKRYVHPQLERFSYDIGASRAALVSLVRGAAPAGEAAALEQALGALQVLEPRVEAAHIVVPIALEVPQAWLAAPPPAATSGTPLTEAELQALEQALEPWDAFLLYAVRQFALDSEDSALRKRLFTLLLDSRYRLIALLSGEAPAGDPLPVLFSEAWNELRAIVADAQAAGVLDASLLRYAAFVDAGDALFALQQAAPGLRLQVSVEGLRQMARSLRPGEGADPLAHDWNIDPQLRKLFDVEEVEAPAPTRSSLGPLIRAAYAGDEPAASRSLDRWLPTAGELAAYQARVAELLRKTSATELQRGKLAAPYDAVYRHLVPTTALVESCWRQYVRRGGKPSYLRSQAGSVGIMQINQHVWRGFYDVQRLRWDTAYNAAAGAQILLRYLKDYAIPFAERSGDPDHAARAAYAVYNAGPRAAGRFASPQPHPREARVDGHLWQIYRGIAAGGAADLASCGVKTTMD